MDKFINLYEISKMSKIKTNEFMNYGIYLMKTTIEEKQFIFEKLKEEYPNDPSIYYYYGFELKNIDTDSAYKLFNISFKIYPKNIENTIELFSNLIQKKEQKEVIKIINEYDLLEIFIYDWRFVCIYYECIRKYSNIKCLQYIKKAISMFESKKNKNKEETLGYFTAYDHLINIYINLSNNDMALKYMEKKMILIDMDKNVDNSIKKNAISNYIFTSNYMYDIDIEEKFNELNKHYYNNYLPIKQNKNKKIRIGYISSDFTGHAVSNFILPILKNHSEIFDIYLFVISDNIDEILNNYNYYNINNMKEKDIAILINNLKIDILFDLNGHTSGNKLDVFTYKPAPIAITYIGSPITTGLNCIDYYLTDGIADNMDSTQKYSEKLIRMSRFHLLYESIIIPDVFAVNKTKSERIVLGSLNKEGKTNKFVLDSWKSILKECPNTIILIKIELQDDREERTKFYLKHLDIEKRRLLIISSVDDKEYMKLYTRIDILLDTFPYSGTTTSCNALYNSVPIITLYNKNIHAHNMTSSLLINIGFPELVSYSVEEYIKKTVELINTPKKIDEYKEQIRNKFLEIMEPTLFMKEYEEILIDLYKKQKSI